MKSIVSIYKNSFVFKTINKLENKYYIRKLTNQDFTILCPNCTGGVLSHRLEKQFNSPTVNILINTSDFCSFLEHIRFYLDSEFENGGFNANRNPVGILKGNGADIPDITVNFVHYASYEDGVEKWNARKERILWDSLYVLMYDTDNILEDDPSKVHMAKQEDVAKFEAFECNNKVLLTSFKERKSLYSFYIKPKKVKNQNPLVFLTRDIIGLTNLEKEFDFVGFLNQK